MISLWVISVFLLFNFSSTVNGQNGACTTPNNQAGSCVAVSQCPSLLAILQDRQRTPAQTQLLRSSQCGGSGAAIRLCCPAPPPVSGPSCTTADNTPGNCVNLDNCPNLKALFNGPKPLPTSTVQYLRRSTCQGPARYNVCCGSGTGGSTVGGAVPTEPEPTGPAPDVSGLLPAPDQCGIEAGEVRIVGGNETELDQYPWMGLVEYRTPRDTISLGCGAALISTRYVITAGHCVFGDVLTQLGTPINVRLGEYDKRQGKDCVMIAGGEDCNDEPVTIAIETIISHPRYQPSTGSQKNDIAMLRLASDAPYTYFIRPICLPTSDITQQSNIQAIVAGWGATETGRSSNVKLHLQIPLVPLTTCQVAYNNPRLRAELWDRQICAGGEVGKDSCRGDSGGPLMYAESLQWTLHGVVSFGPTPCALANVPGVYTKVWAYMDWIKRQIKA